MRAVAITGLGVLSSAGRGLAALMDAVRSGRCTIGPNPELAALGLRCVLSGRVPGVDAAFADLPIAPADRDFFGRFAKLGAVAAFDAMRDAPPIGRVIVATAVGPMGELEVCFRDTLCSERHPMRTRAVTRVTPSFLATWLAGAFHAPRGGRVVSAACVSALEALRDAVELVASGQEEAVLAGAVDEDAASTYWAFDAQRLLGQARTVDARTRALSGRPGGFLPAGGAAFFVIEAEDAARARGRTPAARIDGVAIRSEPRVLAFPRAAYVAALDEARAWGLPDLVLAHAPPTLADTDELDALDEVLGIAARRTPVRSFKSLFGYALGAAAAIDVALAVGQIAGAEVLPNDDGPRIPRFAASLDVASVPVDRVVKTAYAQGGVAGAITLARIA